MMTRSLLPARAALGSEAGAQAVPGEARRVEAGARGRALNDARHHAVAQAPVLDPGAHAADGAEATSLGAPEPPGEPQDEQRPVAHAHERVGKGGREGALCAWLMAARARARVEGRRPASARSAR
jgi:hypothetical protein